ncbi:hypothetical protein [Aliihoeflea sp. 2WW]|uniref:hypothetical protein n=1 Tax=Aliihoeflea sp. 2WW TaxID=1381123 RepID=UPI0012692A79|nr:hypothetical protein [Aliihoeflea sp. 2WW]
MNRSRTINLDRTIITCAQLRGLTFLFKGAAIRHLLELRRFNPNQPRVPRGHRHGGRWVAEGHSFEAQVHRVSHDLPELPEERPSSGRERHRVARLIAAFLREATVTLRLGAILTRYVWLAESTAADIRAYLDEPKSLDDLHKGVGEPKAGYDKHHIVERSSALDDGFPDTLVNGPDNLVRIPRFKHWEITGWYATRQVELGGLSPREYLRGARWEARMAMGLHALREAGVLEK